MRVGLTHSRGALPGLAAELERRGHDVEWQPLVATPPLAGEQLVAGALALAGCRWLVFPSRSAVAAWFGHALPELRGRGEPKRAAASRLARLSSDGGPALAVTGAGTADEVRRLGREADVAGGGDARSLAEAVVARSAPGDRVGLVQGSIAGDALRSALEAAGREVVVATVYRTVTRPWTGAPCDVTLFASPSAAAAFGAARLARTRPVAIGEVTRAALRRLGHEATVARTPDVPGAVAAIEAAPPASAAAPRREREARP